ncbi:hypothetical protein CoNPh27_CDS0053 [Staphylococcus phage S-CoN_Ph27]|nr:hypothetical protein CoNPh27_CDS0053 [Staphylococcus phage S-CoN_Ph27]
MHPLRLNNRFNPLNAASTSPLFVCPLIVLYSCLVSIH